MDEASRIPCVRSFQVALASVFAVLVDCSRGKGCVEDVRSYTYLQLHEGRYPHCKSIEFGR
jgi:hypothetical protein